MWLLDKNDYLVDGDALKQYHMYQFVVYIKLEIKQGEHNFKIRIKRILNNFSLFLPSISQ